MAHENATVLILEGFRSVDIPVARTGANGLSDLRFTLVPVYSEAVNVNALRPRPTLRSRFEDAGVVFSAGYVSDWSRVRPRGAATRIIGRALLDTSVTIDLEKIVRARGATVFLQAVCRCPSAIGSPR